MMEVCAGESFSREIWSLFGDDPLLIMHSCGNKSRFTPRHDSPVENHAIRVN